MSTNTLPKFPASGQPIPANVEHAVSVSLPYWQDNIDYEEGHPRIAAAMVSGYPRFFYHRAVQEIEARHGQAGEACLVFPSRRVAEQCHDFILKFAAPPAGAGPDGEDAGASEVRIMEFQVPSSPWLPVEDLRHRTLSVYPVFYTRDWAAGTAKLFWQHSGEIVSSRLASHCLRALGGLASPPRSPTTASKVSTRPSSTSWVPRQGHPRYQRQRPTSSSARLTNASSGESDVSPVISTAQSATDPDETAEYLEIRYGRNVEVATGDTYCKKALRQRIAQAIQSPSELDTDEPQTATVTAEDVFLFPTGMSAIYGAHRFLQAALTSGSEDPSSTTGQVATVCFGFPYTDTLKILQKFGPECHFLAYGDDRDYVGLEDLLRRTNAASTATNAVTPRPVRGLFCECPGNPLLKTPDLPRLRKLADRYGFVIVVDETIGNFVNVNTLAYADMVVSSLTKVFSGDSNVMGGSLILNPAAPYYALLKTAIWTHYEDLYWCEDAVFMERNSRTFRDRVRRINTNAEALADMLRGHPLVKDVFYPKYVQRDHYEQIKYPDGGYGGLLSIVLADPAATPALYDAMICAKGPSLGTNFTLVSPYTILAHYHELDWAEKYGVSRNLIRCSIGLEDTDNLLRAFRAALDIAAADSNLRGKKA
ncbi:Cystathionine gamma-synthase [Tieghemiomyces parasiticus]|uniref:Cystathionine gamma-synthase n=1 Tax=Tieghemiomyces parasiticus TaxID=78921 RepID=A0A9W8DQA7_9FUNG|nr:Cystathionine gamma-synthase [Tieghemiomyces parasiticus]